MTPRPGGPRPGLPALAAALAAATLHAACASAAPPSPPAATPAATAEAAPAPATGEARTLFARRTPFQYLRVVEDPSDGVRVLCDESCSYIQGLQRLADPRSLGLPYMRSAMLALAALPGEPRALLFLGMGIGAMPSFASDRFPAARIDVVEIDPEIPAVAREYFGFREGPRLAVHVADAADYVKASHERWDAIFLDALFGPAVPPQLSTEEFFRALAARLSPGGVLAVNLAPEALDPAVASRVATLRRIFASVLLLPTTSSSNVLVLASGSPLPTGDALATRARALATAKRFGFDLGSLALLPPR